MCPVNTDQSTEGAGQTMMSDKRRVLLQHTKAATGGAIVHPVPTHRLPHGRRRDFTTVRLTLFHIQTIRLMVHVSVDRLSFIVHSLVINSPLIFIKLKFRNTASCQHLRHHRLYSNLFKNVDVLLGVEERQGEGGGVGGQEEGAELPPSSLLTGV